MTDSKRDIGAEILEGLRELKRGDHGRVINVPNVGAHRVALRARSCSLRIANPRALLDVA